MVRITRRRNNRLAPRKSARASPLSRARNPRAQKATAPPRRSPKPSRFDVVGPRRFSSGAVVAGRGAHAICANAPTDNGLIARLRAARDHHVGFAALDHAQTIRRASVRSSRKAAVVAHVSGRGARRAGSRVAPTKYSAATCKMKKTGKSSGSRRPFQVVVHSLRFQGAHRGPTPILIAIRFRWQHCAHPHRGPSRYRASSPAPSPRVGEASQFFSLPWASAARRHGLTRRPARKTPAVANRARSRIEIFSPHRRSGQCTRSHQRRVIFPRARCARPSGRPTSPRTELPTGRHRAQSRDHHPATISLCCAHKNNSAAWQVKGGTRLP